MAKPSPAHLARARKLLRQLQLHGPFGRTCESHVCDEEQVKDIATALAEVEALLEVAGCRSIEAAREADLAAVRADIDVLRGELKASEDGSGITNVVEQYESRLQSACRDALREAAADLERIAKGPFTGDGILGPLHAIGLATGFQWAADRLRARAEEK